jgi:GNAT superfamily N-acetyltransferase
VQLSLQSAGNDDLAFCEWLNRRNMGAYLATRGIAWDTSRFLASWTAFENFVILADSHRVGLLRLIPEQEALGLRDLQVIPERRGQGIGSWSLRQAERMATGRGFRRLQLRVYEDNPARALYARFGFKEESVVDGTVHMVLGLSIVAT